MPSVLGFPRPAGERIQDISTYLMQSYQKWNAMLRGKLNCNLEVTLSSGAATTTITDGRISADSSFLPCPLTANAAAEIGSGTLYVSERKIGEATLSHSSNAETDRTYVISILG